MLSCGASDNGAISFAGNTGSKSIVTKDVDGISGESFSVCLYVKRKRVDAVEHLLTMGALTTRGGVFMRFWSSNKMQFGFRSDNTVTSSAFPSDTGVWVHWAFVYNKVGNGMSIFRDGVAQGLAGAGNGGTSQGPTTATGAIHLGVKKWDTSNSPFNGNMDELRVYVARALTQVDVASMMTNPITDDRGLVLAMTFDFSADLGKDSSCRGIGDATSVTGVVLVTGKECGAEDNSGAATCRG